MLDTIGRYFQAAANVVHKSFDKERNSVNATLELTSMYNPVALPGAWIGLIYKEAQRLKHAPQGQVLAAS